MTTTTSIGSSLIPASSSRAIPHSGGCVGGVLHAAGRLKRAACGVNRARRSFRPGFVGRLSYRANSAATVPTLPKPDGHSRPLGEEEAQGIPAARDRAGAIPPFRIGASVRLDANGNPIKFIPYSAGSAFCRIRIAEVHRRITSIRFVAPFRHPGLPSPSITPVRRPRPSQRRSVRSASWDAAAVGGPGPSSRRSSPRPVVITPGQGEGF